MAISLKPPADESFGGRLRRITGWQALVCVLFSILLTGAMLFVVQPWLEDRIDGDNVLYDQFNGYSANEANQAVESWGDSGRTAYLGFTLLDIVVALLVAVALALAISWLGRKWMSRRFAPVWALLPLLAGAFDIVEDLLLAIIVLWYPERANWLVRVASAATQAKLWLWLATILILIVGTIILFVRKRAENVEREAVEEPLASAVPADEHRHGLEERPVYPYETTTDLEVEPVDADVSREEATELVVEGDELAEGREAEPLSEDERRS